MAQWMVCVFSVMAPRVMVMVFVGGFWAVILQVGFEFDIAIF